MKARVVFFDLGGTLLVMRRDRIFRRVLNEEGLDASLDMIHSTYLGLESWWLSDYGYKVMSPEDTTEAYRHFDEKVFQSLFPDRGAPEALRVSRLVRKRWPELEKEIPLALYPDVEPTLSMLSRDGIAMGLISNAPADTDRVVQALGLSKYLSTIVISGAVGYTKPNPEIFRIALRQASYDADQAAHVGDLFEADIVGARNAGVKGILIDRDGSHEGLDCPRVRALTDIFPLLN